MEDLIPPEQLSQILRWSLKATNEKGALRIAEEGFGDGIKNPATRELIEQVLFTRRFVPTYFIALSIVLAVCASRHRYTCYSRWRNGRRNRDLIRSANQHHDHTPASSSSSSTPRGAPSPPIKPTKSRLKLEANEQTSLLSQVEQLEQADKSFLGQCQCRFDAFLAYQPAPIPAITSSSNQLPPNGTTMIIIMLFTVNLFYLFFHIPFSIPMLFALADRAGLLFVANIPILYMLAAKTNQPIKFLTGWSYESLNIFHRRLGEWMIAMATVHAAGMFGVWYTLLRPLHFSLFRFLSTRLVLVGIFAFLSYLAIYVTSTAYFRLLYYEIFLGFHILLQVSALVLLFFHHPNARVYVVTSFAIWALDRLLLRMFISTKKLVATLQIADDGETVLLFCYVPIRRLQKALDITCGWEAGQHVFVTLLGMGWRHRIQAHPFTIASPSPPSSLGAGNWPLQLTIRAQDGFSKEILEYAKFHQHTEIILEGPYGSLYALESLKNADRSCLIAGGSGIAVTYPLTWALLVEDDADALVSARTTYQNGRKLVPNINKTHTLALDESIMHLWVKSHDSHARWVTMLPKAESLRGVLSGHTSKTDKAATEVADLVVHLPSTREATRNLGSLHDRPDIGMELRKWIQGIESTENGSVCVVVSGPDGLVRDVRNAVARLLLEGWHIELHIEKFGW